MVINNSELIELFGSKEQKESYEKNKKVATNTKKAILNRLKSQYKIVKDLGRGRYKIDEKMDSNVAIPNDKMIHPIFGSLLPTIMINVKNYHDAGEVFCLSLNSIYSKFNMINENYPKMSSRRNLTAQTLSISKDIVNEFFEITHKNLKYYLDKSVELLSTLGLIEYNMLMYVSLIEKEFVHDSHTLESDLSIKVQRRRATKEEQQFITDCNRIIREKYNIKEKVRIFGKPLKELKTMLKTINVDYSYYCYELICLDKESIVKIADFYGVDNLQTLSRQFVENFIIATTLNAKNRHEKAIIENLEEFYRFSESYLLDFTNLSNVTLDPNSESVFIPEYVVTTNDDGFGNLDINIKKSN